MLLLSGSCQQNPFTFTYISNFQAGFALESGKAGSCRAGPLSPALLSLHQCVDTGGLELMRMNNQRVWAVNFSRAAQATCYSSLSCRFISILGSVDEEPSAECLGFGAAQPVQGSVFCQVLAGEWRKLSWFFSGFSWIFSQGAQTCRTRRSWLLKKSWGVEVPVFTGVHPCPLHQARVVGARVPMWWDAKPFGSCS